MSDGHSDVRAGEERDIDFRNMTDDGKVELNLPREDAMERDPPGGRAGSTGGVSDKSGGTVFVGAPEWGSTARASHFRLSRSPLVRGRELQ